MIVYQRDRRDERKNDLFRAQSSGVDERSENGQVRYFVRLREIEHVGRTEVNWPQVARTAQFPIRYVKAI